MLERKLPLLPRYRQRVRFVPNDLGRPVWVDYPHFDLGFHLRRTAVPSPGGDKELKELGARVLAQALDREKPLWELWMIEGLADGRWALLSKSHHCMVDGVSGTSLLSTLFDDDVSAEPEPWAPGRGADGPGARHASARDTAVLLRGADRRLGRDDGGGQPPDGHDAVRAVPRGPGSAAPGDGTRARSSLLGPVGPHRRWTWVRYRLADVKTIRAGLGGTVNDVVLAVIAGAFRTLLQARGESTQGRTLKTMVPVSVRRDTESGQISNRIAAVYPELPLDTPDLVAVLGKVREQMDGIKQSHQAVAADVLTSMAGFQPPELIAQASRLAAQMTDTATESVYETVATNVPGPQKPMFALGRQLLEMLPWIPLQSPVRINVPISSYNGGLVFGIVGDYDSSPDIEVLADGIHAGLEQLKAAATSPAERR